MGIEYELRFLALDPSAVISWLTEVGAAFRGDSVLTDEWYAPERIVDYKTHEQWLASGNAVPIRIRTSPRGCVIEVKRPLSSDYTVNIEARLPLDSSASGAAFLHAMGYRLLVSLTKKRYEYKLEAVTICVDCYSDKFTIVEVELDDLSDPEHSSFLWVEAAIAALDCTRLEESAALFVIRSRLAEAVSG